MLYKGRKQVVGTQVNVTADQRKIHNFSCFLLAVIVRTALHKERTHYPLNVRRIRMQVLSTISFLLRLIIFSICCSSAVSADISYGLGKSSSSSKGMMRREEGEYNVYNAYSYSGGKRKTLDPKEWSKSSKINNMVSLLLLSEEEKKKLGPEEKSLLSPSTLTILLSSSDPIHTTTTWWLSCTHFFPDKSFAFVDFFPNLIMPFPFPSLLPTTKSLQ